MSAPVFPNFGKWSSAELQKAEKAAICFLSQNSQGIAETFEKRLALMKQVAERLKSPKLTFDERMMCLSLMEELSTALSESARGFFEIGCVPSVANLMRR